MLQESASTEWGPVHILRNPPIAWRLYQFFLLVVCLVTVVRLLSVWRTALPFRLSKQLGNPAFIKTIERSRNSLKQWIFCTFLVWALLASTSVYNICENQLSRYNIRIWNPWALLTLADNANILTETLAVICFVFVVRWHLVTRIEYLNK
jgi:hypothetical protein